MEFGPIASSLRRNKVGALLIALQIALTLAVLCNALFIIEQQSRLSREPSGIADESSVFVISNQWAGRADDIESRERADLTALRGLPDVIDASVSPVQPLGGRGMGMSISLHPDRPKSGVGMSVFPADDHVLAALGLRLIAGRNFRPEDVQVAHGVTENLASWGSIIITRRLAQQLDPSGNVLGRVASLAPGRTTATIVGVVERLGVSGDTASASMGANAILVPLFWVDSSVYYFVHSKSGALPATLKAARAALYGSTRQRTVGSIRSVAEARLDLYRGARGEALVMAVISAILLATTAFGIYGLTSFWVTQRRRHIGIRRALGASASSILGYFLTENLMIAGAGVALGIALGLLGNLWLLQTIALPRMPIQYWLVGIGVILCLGQLAVLAPARRAAAVPPAVAARGI